MTNNFDTIKYNLASEKILFVRIEPARSIIDSLAVIAGTTYSMTFAFDHPSKIKVDTTLCTKVTTVANNYEWSFNESTREIIIKLPSAKSNYHNVVCFHYLFYTNSIDRYCYETPDDDSTPMRFYQARLLGQPQFSITQEDLLDKVFTIGNTTINLINLDNDFNQYLGNNDSFSRKELKIWKALDAKENIKKVYFGVCSNITIGESVSISVDNNLSVIDRTFYPTGDLATSTFSATGYPNINPIHLGLPIYKIYSRASKTYATQAYVVPGTIARSMDSTLIAGANAAIYDGYSLVNIDYSADRSKTANREWKACFASTASSTLEETNVTYALVGGGVFYSIQVADKLKYRTGDYVSLKIGGIWYNSYGVYHIDYDSITQEIIIRVPQFGQVPFGTVDIRRYAIPQITITEGIYRFNLAPIDGYTLSVDTDGVYKIVFNNNMEDEFTLGPLDPQSDFIDLGLSPDAKICYRVYNEDDLNHAVVLEDFLNDGGIITEGASFTTQSATDIETNFSIPYYGTTDFPTLRSIIQDFLNSTFGFLSVDLDFKTKYFLIDSIASGIEITDNEIMLGSQTTDIRYSDIITALDFKNIHGEDIFSRDANLSLPASYYRTTYETKAEDKRAVYLHDIQNTRFITHLMLDLTNVKTRMLDVLKERRNTIQFKTKGINFDTILGDDLTIVSDKTIPSSGTNFKVFSANNNTIETEIRAIDLLGI